MSGDGCDPDEYPDEAFGARVSESQADHGPVAGVDDGLDDRTGQGKSTGLWDRSAPTLAAVMPPGAVPP